MTAVEWLVEQLYNNEKLFMSGDGNVLDDILEQAKEMEKIQKIEFACAVYDKYNFCPQEISFREECEQFKLE